MTYKTDIHLKVLNLTMARSLSLDEFLRIHALYKQYLSYSALYGSGFNYYDSRSVPAALPYVPTPYQAPGGGSAISSAPLPSFILPGDAPRGTHSAETRVQETLERRSYSQWTTICRFCRGDHLSRDCPRVCTSTYCKKAELHDMRDCPRKTDKVKQERLDCRLCSGDHDFMQCRYLCQEPKCLFKLETYGKEPHDTHHCPKNMYYCTICQKSGHSTERCYYRCLECSSKTPYHSKH